MPLEKINVIGCELVAGQALSLFAGIWAIERRQMLASFIHSLRLGKGCR